MKNPHIMEKVAILLSASPAAAFALFVWLLPTALTIAAMVFWEIPAGSMLWVVGGAEIICVSVLVACFVVYRDRV